MYRGFTYRQVFTVEVIKKMEGLEFLLHPALLFQYNLHPLHSMIGYTMAIQKLLQRVENYQNVKKSLMCNCKRRLTEVHIKYDINIIE